MNNLINKFKDTFEYVDGHLYWKITKGTRAIKGSKAGKLRKDGYYDVGLDGKYYLIHRIVYALHYNKLPEIIDHIDRNRSNNKIENLRESDVNYNVWNSSISSANTTGVKGIRKVKRGNYEAFEARVAIKSKTIQVGTFKTLEEAKSAIQIKREELHQEYACNG